MIDRHNWRVGNRIHPYAVKSGVAVEGAKMNSRRSPSKQWLAELHARFLAEHKHLVGLKTILALKEETDRVGLLPINDINIVRPVIYVIIYIICGRYVKRRVCLEEVRKGLSLDDPKINPGSVADLINELI